MSQPEMPPALSFFERDWSLSEGMGRRRVDSSLNHASPQSQNIDGTSPGAAGGLLGAVPCTSLMRRGSYRNLHVCWCRGRTVGLTLWGDSAEVQGAELEQSEDAIVSVSSCRVGDFNGAPTQRPELPRPPRVPQSQHALFDDLSTHLFELVFIIFPYPAASASVGRQGMQRAHQGVVLVWGLLEACGTTSQHSHWSDVS